MKTYRRPWGDKPGDLMGLLSEFRRQIWLDCATRKWTHRCLFSAELNGRFTVECMPNPCTPATIKGCDRLVRSPYQRCAEMLSLLRTHTVELKWTSKRKILMVKTVGKRMRGECPVTGVGAPGSGAPRILFLTAFPIDISRF